MLLNNPDARPWWKNQGRGHLLGIAVLALLVAAGGWLMGGAVRPSLPRGVTVAFLGDVMLGRGIAEAHLSEDWDTTFAAIRPILSQADLAIANLESPLTGLPLLRPGYDLRAPVEATRALTSAGIRAVTIANNHVEDAGMQGVNETLEALAGAGIDTLGPTYGTRIMQVGAWKLGWLAIDAVNHPLELETILRDIHRLRGEVDWVIVSIHWGIEYQGAPDAEQREAARQMVLAGADVVAGHHPHLLQPAEWVEVRGEKRRGLVLYSLGNALFDQPAPPAARQGALVTVRLGEGGVASADVSPFLIDLDQGKVVPIHGKIADGIRQTLGLGDIDQ